MSYNGYSNGFFSTLLLVNCLTDDNPMQHTNRCQCRHGLCKRKKPYINGVFEDHKCPRRNVKKYYNLLIYKSIFYFMLPQKGTAYGEYLYYKTKIYPWVSLSLIDVVNNLDNTFRVSANFFTSKYRPFSIFKPPNKNNICFLNLRIFYWL